MLRDSYIYPFVSKLNGEEPFNFQKTRIKKESVPSLWEKKDIVREFLRKGQHLLTENRYFVLSQLSLKKCGFRAKSTERYCVYRYICLIIDYRIPMQDNHFFSFLFLFLYFFLG